MASNPPGQCCTIGVRHQGETTGQSIKIANGSIDAYLTTPPEGTAKKGSVLYISDIWNISTNSKLMADQFAANGYTTLIPDLFNGDVYAPEKTEIIQWITQGTNGDNPHTPEGVDPIIVAGLDYLKAQGETKIGAVGYCFGAKYVARHYKTGIQVGYVAHPSFVTDDELASISGPLSISAAETDPIFPVEMRQKSEDILRKTGQPYQINLFSGVAHGFAVRGDPAVRAERFAKEQAFFQAVQWFDEYLQ